VPEPRDLVAERLYAAAWAVDHRDPERYAACLTTDATFQLDIADGIGWSACGRDNIVAASLQGWRDQTSQRRHTLVNATIQVNANSAHSISYLVLYGTEGRRTTLLTTGVYNDVLRHEDGHWLIASRHLRCDAPF
jgi:3-phenylpropionate/cinnamic acid dioxygenase small subunit